MTDLSELIARLERATGPDRGLDAAIWYALIEQPRPGDKRDQDMIKRWPAYTGSLDAALALKNLVLPGRAAAIGDMAFEGDHRKPWAVIWSPGGTPGPSAEGATTAIALLLALLRTYEVHHD